MRPAARTLAVAGLLPVLGLTATAASAAWLTTGAGSGTSLATRLGTPTAAAGTVSHNSVTITVTAATSGPQAASHVVTRRTGTAAPVVVCAAATTSCTDDNVAASTSYAYEVVAALGAWRSPAASVPVTTPAAPVQVKPKPSRVVLVQGTPSAAGTAGQGDQVVVEFDTEMAPQSLCSAWTGTATSFSVRENVSTVSISTAQALTFSSPVCGTRSIGSISLGGAYNASSTVPLLFQREGENDRSSMTYDTVTRRLTITLGRLASGTASTGVLAGTPTYTPDAGITGKTGAAVDATPYAGTASRF